MKVDSHYTGQCLCNKVAFEIKGEFDRFFLCHCSRCKKDTGSAHAANLFSSDAQIHWTQGEDQVTLFQLEGTRHMKAFCKNCGTSLPYKIKNQLVVVPAGVLDTPVSTKITAHIFCENTALWEEGIHSSLKFDQLPK